MGVRTVPLSTDSPTVRQQHLRRQLRLLPLGDAVQRAAEAFFRFRFRGARSEALWCDSEHVWMGRETFLHWALWDAAINIPWVVASVSAAPHDSEELRKAVRVELLDYWTALVADLPQKKSPGWLPLP